MKIAIIFKPDTPIQIPSLGGMSNFVYFLSKGLVNAGHDVTVFCSKNSKLAKGVKAIKFPIEEREVNIYKAGNKFYNYINKNFKDKDEIVGKSFGELAQRFHNKTEYFFKTFTQVYLGKFDVIHIIDHELLSHYPALLLSIPNVISLHGDYDLLSKHEQRMFQQAGKMQKHKKTKTQFVSVSKYVQKKYSKYIKSSLIYNSVNFESLDFKKDKKDLVKLRRGAGYIAYLGRIEHMKGVDFAIKFSKKYNIPLVIAGSISDMWYFENKVKPHVDGKLIKFIGKVNEKQKNKLLGNAKAMIMPTRYEEAFGRVVVEAMACGTPVIAFKKGALPELVINNKTGFLIQPENLQQCKKAFDKLENIKPEVCRKFVEKNFTLNRLIKDYEKLYNRIGK